MTFGRMHAGLSVWFHRSSIIASHIADSLWKWKFRARVIMLDPRTLHTRGDFMLRRAALVVGLVGLFLLPTHDRIVTAAADNPLEGVWQVMDVGGQPAAGVYIFTGKHYSIMFATTDRPQIEDTSKATADELRAMWGPMAANAGTYDVSGNLVTIRPIVAKIPVVMKPGANEVYAFRAEGNTLSLTQQRNARGVTVQNAATTRLMRVE